MFSLVMGLSGLLCGAIAGGWYGRRRSGAAELAGVLRRAAAGESAVRADDRLPAELAGPLNAVLERAAAADAATARAAGRLAAERTRLAGARDRLARTAAESARSFGEIERTASGVAADVAVVSAGADELGASIEEISRNAGEALTVAADAAQLSVQAGQLMTKLGDSSAQIGDVVKVITSIAGQTNLLALNATIEAARAGEMGKGFAVVASEVKDLAQETAKATTGITEQIAGIQQDTAGAVEAIREITAVIERINRYQATIAGTVREQSATTYEMARGIAEASAHAELIAATVGAAGGRIRSDAAVELIEEVRAALAGADADLSIARR